MECFCAYGRERQARAPWFFLYGLAHDRLRLANQPQVDGFNERVARLQKNSCGEATRSAGLKMDVHSWFTTRAPARHDSTRTTGDVARGCAADAAVLLVVENAVGAALLVTAGERPAADTAACTAPQRAAHGLGVLVGPVDAG